MRLETLSVQSIEKVSPTKPSSSAAILVAAQVNPRSRLVTLLGSTKSTESVAEGVVRLRFNSPRRSHR